MADEKATIDILSTIYQMGYRLASLVGGALGLIIAARIGWPQTYMAMGAILLAVGFVGLWAPDCRQGDGSEAAKRERTSKCARCARRASFTPPSATARWPWWACCGRGRSGWCWPSWSCRWPMPPEDRPNPTDFTLNWGPWIIVATIVLPALVAGWLVGAEARRQASADARMLRPRAGATYALDHLYRALVLPLVEFVGRLGWSLVLILAVVLTYRICDAIWGTFAYPFYLG